jgi:hypothetical protein
MDKTDEIAKFQALMSLAVAQDGDLTNEIRYQKDVLKSLGLTEGEILDLIHDRHARAPISTGRAQIALAAVRHAAGLPHHAGPSTVRRSWSPTQAFDERTEQYMRASGREPRSRPPVAPLAAPQKHSTETYKVPLALPAAPTAADQPNTLQPSVALQVPYGVSQDGDLVPAREADADAVYACPGCAGLLVLHAGAVRTRHFAHKASTACDGETLAHITAKLLVAKIIDEHHDSKARITLLCTCSKCGSPVQRELPHSAFTSSAVEERIGPFVCDVVAFKESRPVLAIEIFNSHAVGDEKAKQLELPWIELTAAEVLADPFNWRPVQMRLKPTLCFDCKAERAELERVAAHWKLPLSEPLYVAAVAPCWGCKEQIVWYWWRGVPFAQEKPPEPVPRTLQFRFSKMYGGKYWMNICPGCRAPQGDNFVFLASDSPFSKLPISETKEMKASRQNQNAAVVSQFMEVIKRNMGGY